MGAVGNYEVVDQEETLSGTPVEYIVEAPPGKRVLSGSLVWDLTGSVQVHTSSPNEDGTEWSFLASSSSAATVTFRVVCAEMC